MSLRDYYDEYFEYAGAGTTEPPIIFHRWAGISILGTLLGRQIYLPFGHGQIFPNQYIMLMGPAGCRKSTAIGIASKLLKQTGYTRFAADRTSKERFLVDMKQYEGNTEEIEDLEALSLDDPSEVYVVAEEFTDFTGTNNIEFITMLTKLWDNMDEYKHPKINGISVEVWKPTVNVLSGNTAQNFAVAFPPEALGNGFLSRTILVQGELSGRKVTFPSPPDDLLVATLVARLKEMKKLIKGEVTIAPKARLLCDKIYRGFKDMEDHRFQQYGNRRFTHMLKLAMLLAAANFSLAISEEHILQANTILHYTEVKMPKALGEFGKSKYSDVSNKVIEILSQTSKPLTIKDLWRRVYTDLAKQTELAELLRNLREAHKIQILTVKGEQGFLLRQEFVEKWDKGLILEDWLLPEEMV